MKKKFIVVIAILLVIVAVSMSGCTLFTGSSTDNLANSSGTENVTTYTDVSKSELENALTKYREIAESMAERTAIQRRPRPDSI